MKVYDPFPYHPGSPALIQIRAVGKECPCGCGVILKSLLEVYGSEALQSYARRCVRMHYSPQQGPL